MPSMIQPGSKLPVSNPPLTIGSLGVHVGLAVAEGVGVGVGVGVGLAVAEGVGVNVAVGVGLAVAVGVGFGATAQYLPPVFKLVLMFLPPQTIIWLPVHTAV